jgi:pantoate--beta-alanine ligase
MGALHEGHLSLIHQARRDCDLVVVSLFVNPLQFGEGEDFERYPRNEERDALMAEQAGADVLFMPTVQDIYPRPSTKVTVPVVSSRWEGEMRPGHFDGVATVVCKLFHIVAPQVAYFGQKDFQQCAVVRRMVEDLNMRVEIRICPTLREPDGLAMSSRNVYLNADERKIAPRLYAELQSASARILDGRLPVDEVLSMAKNELADAGFSVEYFALVDAESLEPLSEYRAPAALITAARLGRTRLIDNVQVPA